MENLNSTDSSSDRMIGNSSSSGSRNRANRDRNRNDSPNSSRGGRRQYPVPFSPPPVEFSRGTFASVLETGLVGDIRQVQSFVPNFSSPVSSSSKNGVTPSRSPTPYNLPVQTVEEGVIVMDGFLMTPPRGASSSARPSASELGGSGLRNQSSSKTEIPHGKEELRSSRQTKSEAENLRQSKNSDDVSKGPAENLKQSKNSDDVSKGPVENLEQSKNAADVSKGLAENLRQLKISDDVRKGESSSAPMKLEELLSKLIVDIESGNEDNLVEMLDPEEIALLMHPLVDRLFKLEGSSRRKRLSVFEEISSGKEERPRGKEKYLGR